MAHCQAEEEGLSFREAERVVESEFFLNEYSQWGLGTPHQLVILHEMFLHAKAWGQKEAERMCCRGCQNSIREPNSEADQSAMGLIGFQTSQKEIREVYHSVYLLNRLRGFPSSGETRRGIAQQLTRTIPISPPLCLSKAPLLPASPPPARALALKWPPTLP